MWFAAVCGSVALVVSGCRGGAPAAPRVAPETVLYAEPLAAPVTVALEDPAAAYNEPRASEDATLSAAVRTAMQEVAGDRAEITGDPRIDVACRELAAVVARDAAPRPALVDFVTQSLGIVERADRVLVAWDATTAADAVAALRPQMGDALAGYLRVGVGAAPGGAVVALVVRSAGVELAPVPRALAAGEGFELAATLHPRLTDPHVIITRDDGSRELAKLIAEAAAVPPGRTPDSTDGGRRFRARFECGARTGRHWLEIDALGPGGRLTRAQLAIRCGARPPSSFMLEPQVNLSGLATAADMERRLTSIINRQRVHTGLPQLPTDLRVARSAREHSEAVRDAAGAHVASRSPGQRLRVAGVSPRQWFESFLEVDSLGQAAEELMNEAVYRERLVSDAVTDVGVGIAITEGSRLRITITYVLLPPRIEPPAVTRRLADAINALEDSRTNLDLAGVAQRYAAGLALGWRSERLWPGVQGELDMIQRRFAKVSRAVVSVVDAAKLDARELVRDHPVDEIGVGVAQSARYGSQGGVVWVVVFFAEHPRSAYTRR